MILGALFSDKPRCLVTNKPTVITTLNCDNMSVDLMTWQGTGTRMEVENHSCHIQKSSQRKQLIYINIIRMYLYKDALERFSIKWQSGTQLFHMKLIIFDGPVSFPRSVSLHRLKADRLAAIPSNLGGQLGRQLTRQLNILQGGPPKIGRLIYNL